MTELKIIKAVSSLLKKNKKTIAVAESITGGYLSNLLTKLPGSSQTFKLGIVVYSNRAKNKLLKIPLSLAEKYNGVSPKITKKLAENLLNLIGSDYAIAVTGFAGPAAGKFPKGKVFIALAKQKKSKLITASFKGSRQKIRKSAALFALKEFYHFASR